MREKKTWPKPCDFARFGVRFAESRDPRLPVRSNGLCDIARAVGVRSARRGSFIVMLKPDQRAALMTKANQDCGFGFWRNGHRDEPGVSSRTDKSGDAALHESGTGSWGIRCDCGDGYLFHSAEFCCVVDVGNRLIRGEIHRRVLSSVLSNEGARRSIVVAGWNATITGKTHRFGHVARPRDATGSDAAIPMGRMNFAMTWIGILVGRISAGGASDGDR